MAFILVQVKDNNGQTTLVDNLGTGAILSLKSDKTWTSAPAGSIGPNEVCCINGNVVVYNPTGNEPVAFPFLLNTPGGLSGINLVAL